ncbi:hypothetical protein [Weissella cibaria]|uniref:hypothetical protein n=1 Tax=Weissella cibaria TaxID=137591 RepID=UPI0013DA60B8|nr:hypothetical protein [Weissella cibaria]NFA02240.1 hypothetical protein [Weissella cibaria]
MTYSPFVELLKDLEKRVTDQVNVPVFRVLPDPEQLEPFVVLSDHTDNDLALRTGLAASDTTLSVHVFYPANSRIKFENALYKLRGVIAQSNRVINVSTSQTVFDNSIGRDVYHAVISVRAII